MRFLAFPFGWFYIDIDRTFCRESPEGRSGTTVFSRITVMKFLIYNIAYGTGNPGGEYRRLLTSHHYLAAPKRPFRKIVRFIAAQCPDIVGLVEADFGSTRTGGINQVETLAGELGHFRFYRPKYAPDSPLVRLPYLKYQGNAFLTGQAESSCTFDFFPCGWKKLILSIRSGGIRFILVHLALTRQVRRTQLEYLAERLKPGEPTVVAGDFNTFAGARELARFMERCSLTSADPDGRATYPSWKPGRQLDYILCSPEVEVRDFDVPRVRFSDHLPLVAHLAVARPQQQEVSA